MWRWWWSELKQFKNSKCGSGGDGSGRRKNKNFEQERKKLIVDRRRGKTLFSARKVCNRLVFGQ